MDDNDPLDQSLSDLIGSSAPTIADEDGALRLIVRRARGRVMHRRLVASAVTIALVAAIATLAMVSGDGDNGKVRVQATSPTTVPGLPTPPGADFCAGSHSRPPAVAMRVTTNGHPGNEWQIPVGTNGISLHMTVRQRVDTFVHTAVFQVRTRDLDHVVKHFPTHHNWEPGVHEVRIDWDGRDDAGNLLTPGVYSFRLGARVDSQRRVTCADGSGTGIERQEGSGEGYGLGKFLIHPGGPPFAPETPVLGSLDLTKGTVFGIAPGNVKPEAVLATLTVLGPPTRDTGWYIAQARGTDGDCIGNIRTRILRWGNLSFAFWNPQSSPAQFTLWSWALGDTGDQREPQPVVDTPPVGATTPDGVGIGTPLVGLRARYGAGLQVGDDEAGAVMTTSRNEILLFSLVDGKVSGIQSRLSFC